MYSPLAIFDSGIGGLSLVRYLEAHQPSIDFDYFADTAFLPYGDKTPAQILERVNRVVLRLLQRGARALVVACNTADAVAVSELAGSWGVPVFRLIESASQVALRTTVNGRIGVLATSLTAQSGAYTGHLLRGGAVWASTVSCPRLVPLIEESLDSPELKAALREYLAPLLAENIDTLVLGCTHYALIAPLIQELVGPKVNLVDPAECTGRQVLDWLGDYSGRWKKNFLVSGEPDSFFQRAFRTLVPVELPGRGQSPQLLWPEPAPSPSVVRNTVISLESRRRKPPQYALHA